MKLKSYLLRLAGGVTAFVSAVAFVAVGQRFETFFETKKPEVAAAQPAVRQETVVSPPVVEKTDAAVNSEEESKFQFNGGNYYIVADSPRGFKAFSEISITTKDFEAASDEYPYGKPIPPEGYLQAARTYKFTRIGISGKQLAFETETKRGIGYRFVGRFPDQWALALEGRLTKLRNGKKIAESQITFALDERCSC